MSEVLSQLPSLGIAGLLFVMWWFERQERTRSGAGVREALGGIGRAVEINDRLIDVIRANTAALAALREEFHAFRETQGELLGRLSRQLEALEYE